MSTILEMRHYDVKEARKFGAIMAVFFALLGAVLLWRDRGSAAAVFVGLSALFLLLQVSTKSLDTLRKAWMRFSHALGWFNSRVILVLIYYIIMTPIGLAMRIIGKRTLDLAFRDGKPTAWHNAGANHDYKRMF